MKGDNSKESNLMNGINPSLLKKSIQPKFQKDNTVINLNYSGDSEGFIDGNISEKYLSEEESRDMREDLINGSKVKPFQSVGQTVLGKKMQREDRKEEEWDRKMHGKGPRGKSGETRKKGDPQFNPAEISKIVSGLKNHLSLIEGKGGLTGPKKLNEEAEKVGLMEGPEEVHIRPGDPVEHQTTAEVCGKFENCLWNKGEQDVGLEVNS